MTRPTLANSGQLWPKQHFGQRSRLARVRPTLATLAKRENKLWPISGQSRSDKGLARDGQTLATLASAENKLWPKTLAKQRTPLSGCVCACTRVRTRARVGV